MLILFVASFNMEKENLNLFLKLPALYKMKGVIMICEDTLECFLRKTFIKSRFLYNWIQCGSVDVAMKSQWPNLNWIPGKTYLI